MPRGELDTGDEIEILERDLIWAHVRTPADRDGWVPAMTLAAPDVLAGEPELTPEPDVDGGSRDDMPALEDLLAIAAERRAQADAQPPPVAPEPPKAVARARQKKQPSPAHKTKKPSRRTSTRKKRH
jgi:hypothetical protein